MNLYRGECPRCGLQYVQIEPQYYKGIYVGKFVIELCAECADEDDRLSEQMMERRASITEGRTQ